MQTFINNLNFADYALVAIVIVSLSVGLVRGFAREMLSLIAWALALSAAYLFADEAAVHLADYIAEPSLRVVAAFALIFMLILIVASLLAYLVSKLLPSSGVGVIDRFFGMLFGAARAVIFIALLMLTAIFMDFNTRGWWHGSQLMPYFTPLADAMRALVPADWAAFFTPVEAAI